MKRIGRKGDRVLIVMQNEDEEGCWGLLTARPEHNDLWSCIAGRRFDWLGGFPTATALSGYLSSPQYTGARESDDIYTSFCSGLGSQASAWDR